MRRNPFSKGTISLNLDLILLKSKMVNDAWGTIEHFRNPLSTLVSKAVSTQID
jgi:methyl coenzyme M reductase beta subunit